MQSIVIPMTYQSRTGRTETLTIRASLQYTIANSTGKETLEEIRTKAPQSFYTQNRMITGEDYNLFPYVQFPSILKVKSVNRASSGTSRYLDVLDVTGKYSSTNVFAQDGWLYKEEFIGSFPFQWTSTSEILGVIYNQIIPIMSYKEMLHTYYAKYPRYNLPGIIWTTNDASSTGSIGYFSTDGTTPLFVGADATSNLKYIINGAIVKLSAGTGNYFDSQGRIITGTPTLDGDRQYIYAGVMNTNGTTITLSQVLPDGATIEEIIPAFINNLTDSMVDAMVASENASCAAFGSSTLSSGRSAQQPATTPSSVAKSKAPRGGAYSPGNARNSRSKSWNARSTPRLSAYSRKISRTASSDASSGLVMYSIMGRGP
jgi:hypothetical protein